MLRRTFLGLMLGTTGAAVLPPAIRRCRTCGAPTEVHLIDYMRPLGSLERNRTVCFSCTPEARVIDKYWTGFAAATLAHKHQTKCSNCGGDFGYIHVHEGDFEYRLCSKCAPDAKDCRRWVRDLRG